MSRRWRVAHLITRLELGGAQQNTIYSVRHHDRERFDVLLLAGAGGRLDDEARAIPDADVHLVPWLKHEISPLYDLIAVLKLRDWLRRERIDLVHTHSSKAGILGRLAAHLAGVPAVVHTVHGWSFNPMQSPLRRRLYTTLERFVAPLTDRILVVAANHVEAGLREEIGEAGQYGVLRSGIDANAFRTPGRSREEVRGELGYAPEDFVVGTIANMKPQKAPLDFVETALRARTKNPAFKFFFAGDGELMAQVRQRVEETGLAPAFQLLGWRDDVPDLLHAMDAFLLTSRFEGLPRSVLQAMAAGVPVVATAVDGTPEVVEDGVTGCLAQPGEHERLAGQLDRLARDGAFRGSLVAAARARIDDAFDIRKMVADLDALYGWLLETTAPSPR